MTSRNISILIPTYGREYLLTSTICSLIPLGEGKLIVVDQTLVHETETESQLTEWKSSGTIDWIRLDEPSIPHAMNVGLWAARGDIVLFLDDDIEPSADLVEAHRAAHEAHPDAWAVVGQVLQPGEESASRGKWTSRQGLLADLDFPFWSEEPAWVSNVMAGNLSVKREQALAIGGFDENFSGSAYRFETEFARRLIAAGGKIRFEPTASLRHLRAERGGTRSEGSHLTSASPRHGMGDYYFALRSGLSLESLRYMARRPIREVSTRFHLRHPWYIPVKLLGEMRAVMQAIGRTWRGPKLLDSMERDWTEANDTDRMETASTSQQAATP